MLQNAALVMAPTGVSAPCSSWPLFQKCQGDDEEERSGHLFCRVSYHHYIHQQDDLLDFSSCKDYGFDLDV